MIAEVKLKTVDGGYRTVLLRAHAGIPIRYRNIFHTDLMTGITKFFNNSNELDMGSIGEVSDMIPQLTYVMAMAAERRDMGTLTFDTYLTWLEEFSSNAFTEKSNEIISVYFGSTENQSKAKK